MFKQLGFLQLLTDPFARRQPEEKSKGKKTGGGQSQTRALRGSDLSKRKSGEVAPERLVFKDQLVEVHRRPYKRAIGVTLQVSGRIKVSAPRSVPLRKIAAFLESHGEWIEAHLRRYEELRKAHPPKCYRDGEVFLFMGEEVPLKFVPAAGDARQVKILKTEGAIVCEIPRQMWSGFVPTAEHPELAEPLLRFYEKAGRALLGARLDFYSQRMGLRPSAVSFRSQKTRWGSCSSKGRISLNWRLIIAPLEVIDYVVVHELSHLKYYNHSKSFWNLVGTQLPGYRRLRHWLRENQYKADFLARESELHR